MTYFKECHPNQFLQHHKQWLLVQKEVLFKLILPAITTESISLDSSPILSTIFSSSEAAKASSPSISTKPSRLKLK